MDPEQFSVYRHEAVHELMRLNELCEQQFHISFWARWDYEFERGTLTFSQDGVPKVLASIHVIGTTSVSGGTWMWGWANESLPPNVAKAVARVRAFGEAEDIAELKEAELPDAEYLWLGDDCCCSESAWSKGSVSMSRREWLRLRYLFLYRLLSALHARIFYSFNQITG
jgi:hypothetical protein